MFPLICDPVSNPDRYQVFGHGGGSSSVTTSIVDEVDMGVEKHIHSILRIYSELSTAKDLKPCSHIDDLFRDLVRICTQTLSASITKLILQDTRISQILSSLRNICAIAEYHLESCWAESMTVGANEQNIYQHLTKFPYFDNYVELTRMELSAIYSVNPTPPRRIAFIGSGPLPLTSLCLCSILNAKNWSILSYFPSLFASSPTTVVNIDHDPRAISQSLALCKKLGSRAQGMKFVCEEAGCSEHDLSAFDVVYLAALVGASQEEKERVLIGVVRRMREGSLLVVRTAHSLRILLYPDFDATTQAVLACLEVCLTVHPYNHIVNSVIICRVRSRASRSWAV